MCDADLATENTWLKAQNERWQREFTALVAIRNGLSEELNEALKRLEKLDALEGCGVDNWRGYSDAMEMLREEEKVNERLG